MLQEPKIYICWDRRETETSSNHMWKQTNAIQTPDKCNPNTYLFIAITSNGVGRISLVEDEKFCKRIFLLGGANLRSDFD